MTKIRTVSIEIKNKDEKFNQRIDKKRTKLISIDFHFVLLLLVLNTKRHTFNEYLHFAI